MFNFAIILLKHGSPDQITPYQNSTSIDLYKSQPFLMSKLLGVILQSIDCEKKINKRRKVISTDLKAWEKNLPHRCKATISYRGKM